MKRIAVSLAFLFALSGEASAQGDTLAYSARASSWLGHFTVLSANSLMSGVTAGLFQELRGGSFKDGFTRGAFGGTIIYAGKRITAERFAGAGFVGREVAAVGSSVVRNASDGIGTFDRLILPAGFAHVYWNRKHKSAQVKIDAVTLGFLTYAILEEDLYFESGRSLSSGMLVFRTDNKLISYSDGGGHAAGVAVVGLVLRADVAAYGEEFLDRAYAHERVHILQNDQLFITLNDPAEDWLYSKVRPARHLDRYVDINLSTELLRLLSGWIPKHGDRPWEMEPNYLTR